MGAYSNNLQKRLSGREEDKAVGWAEAYALACDLKKEFEENPNISHLAIVYTVPPDNVAYTHAGANGPLKNVVTGLECLVGSLEDVIQQRKTKTDRWTANLHEYNYATDPANFDFLVWLVEAEMTRRRHGASGPLKVKFSHTAALTEKGRLFHENVHQPLLTLVGAVQDASSSGGWRKAFFTTSDMVQASKRGEQIPRLHADDQCMDAVQQWLQDRSGGRQPVTITLREASHWPNRNSSLENWIKFAKDKLKDEYVVFVRDTEKGNEPLDGFDTYPQASFHVRVRMALYEQAKINLFISNGPCMMGVFSDKPYLCFIPLNPPDQPDKEFYANNPEWWVQHNGIGPGEQWPWALPGQEMIWKHDTYENLCEAWDNRAKT